MQLPRIVGFRSLSLALGLGLLLSAPSPGRAQEGDRLKRTRRTVDAAAMQERAAMDERIKQEAAAHRQLEIDAAERLLAENTGIRGEQRADLMLRLADLYFQEGRALYLDEMVIEVGAADACFESGGDCSELIGDHTASQAWQARSIRLYRVILDSYPKYARADEATFYLASALKDSGERDQALIEYKRLVRSYPDSELLPDAYLQIGEHYFDDEDAYKALLAYKKASAFRHHEHYALSLYKLSWCYYNVGEYGPALDTLKRVISWSDGAIEAGETRGAVDLREEAYQDLVRFCADGGDLSDCLGFIDGKGRGDVAVRTMERLGSTYVEQGKHAEALKLYGQLLARDPRSPKAPTYRGEMVGVYKAMGRDDQVVDQLAMMRRDYGPQTSWAQANAAEPGRVQQTQDDLGAALAGTGLEFHTQARKLGAGPQAERLYAAADSLYSTYLADNPDGRRSYEVRFAHAELLYTQKRYDEAYEAYMAVVAADPGGKHSLFSAEAAVHASEHGLPELGEPEGAGIVPFSEAEQRHLAALDQYAELFPEGAKIQESLFRSAWLLYHHNDFAGASQRFRKVVALNPRTQQARYAIELILDALVVVEDWPNLQATSREFMANEQLPASVREEAAQVYERASFRLIEVHLAETGDPRSAAELAWAFSQDFPGSEVADLALNNAAAWLDEAGDRAQAMRVRDQLIQAYPESRFVPDALSALGFGYESSADFERAATLYERLATQHPEHEDVAAALYSAALFRKALGQPEAAVADLGMLLTLEDAGRDRRLIQLDAARWNPDLPAASNSYRWLLEEDLEPDLRLVVTRELVELTGDAGLRERGLAWVADTRPALGEPGQEALGALQFQQLLSVYRPYEGLELSGPDRPVSPREENRVLSEQLAAKARALSQVEAAVGEVLDSGSGPWGVAAIVQLGRAYEDMASTLQDSHVPSFLTDEQARYYVEDMNDQAALVRSKGAEAYGTALAKALELDLYGEDSAFARGRLEELDPLRFPALAEQLLQPTYSSGLRVRADLEEEL
jgi:tetratricopeptide (TPR) repeat protein